MRHCEMIWPVWIIVLLIATALRLPAPDWDYGIAAHPDERFLLGVAQAVPLWGDVCAASSDFPYGHLPVYVARALVLLAPEADPLYIARLFSGLIGVLFVALAGAYGRLLIDKRSHLAWVSAASVALAPFLIQQAHFYTVDPLGALFACGAILAAARQRWRDAGALAGLALACKASLIWVFVPIVGALFYKIRILAKKEQVTLPLTMVLRRCFLRVLLPALITFAVAAPWALLRPMACWRGPFMQAAMVAGRYDFPYTRQYAGTLPYIYPLAQMALWGLGPLITLAGLVGLIATLLTWPRASYSVRLIWGWTVLYFLVTAGLYVKFPRYLLPLYPIWSLWAMRAVLMFNNPYMRAWLCVGMILPTLLLGWAQMSIYAQPHPWQQASRWIYASLPHGATLTVEMWDHALPVPLPQADPTRYHQISLPIFEPDSSEKLTQLQAVQTQAQAIVLASRRGYGALARQPAHYAGTLTWYAQVLTQREPRFWSRCPRIGPLALSDDALADADLPTPVSLAARCGTRYALRLPRLDESFRVYDAPTVVLMLDKATVPE